MSANPTSLGRSSVNPKASASIIARRVLLRGQVQGIGMRPAVAKLARRLKVWGSVCNRNTGLEIVVEGKPAQVHGFLNQLSAALPAAAQITSAEVSGCVPRGLNTFEIVRETSHDVLDAVVPLDRAVCGQCLQEYADENDPRGGYPHISCTECGPRYSIIQEMPFERDQTSLAKFPLCEDCQRDYQDFENRRVHAQTIGCAKCGPSVWYQQGNEIVDDYRQSLNRAVELLQKGMILGLCGLGGYQLLANASNAETVQRLRELKKRFHKPFAMLVANLEAARKLVQISDEEAPLLLDPHNTIVLFERLVTNQIATGVADGLNTLGIMLPTTPVHLELSQHCPFPLIVTSGNREGEPLETEPDAAMFKLAGMADGFLHHNRPILRGIDDSVIRPAAARAIVIRSGRGLAPTALPLETGIPLLATGGQQKNAIALSNCSQAILGPHTGDLDSLSTCQHFHRQREALCQLYQCEPQYIVHDLHPDYYSTRWARQQSLPTIEVQHHHAHIASVMLEHGLLGEQVLGLVCDGTGYGNDGTIWGGEFLLASSKEFKRVGHLMPFSLPGGEAAIHEPWRIAAALLSSACGTERALEICDLQFMSKSAKPILPLIQSGNHSPKTTSLGRLFDGFAALILERDESRFDGEFPMLLEARATQNSTTAPYRFPIIESSDHYELDWREAIEQLVLDLQSDCPETEMATRFHLGLASGLCDGVMLVPDVPIVLAGGCFQNRLLLELVVDQLRNRGRNVFWSQRLPINDGGLAAGQLAIASALISQFS